MTVKVMVAGGIEQRLICSVLGITPKTLRKHFRREIDMAAPEADAMVVASLHQMATTGKNVHAAKWWTQARMGWAERLVVADGGDEDVAQLTDQQLNERIARLRRTAVVARATKPA